jgi:hypothetical protein
MSDDLRAIAVNLDAVVRTVPGVATVFAADPALLRAAKQLTTGPDSVPLTAVSRAGDTLTVTVSVGVTGQNQAPDTAAAVAAAVRAELGGNAAEILVRVSRIAA